MLHSRRGPNIEDKSKLERGGVPSVRMMPQAENLSSFLADGREYQLWQLAPARAESPNFLYFCSLTAQRCFSKVGKGTSSCLSVSRYPSTLPSYADIPAGRSKSADWPINSQCSIV
jgi:hypothetical protein